MRSAQRAGRRNGGLLAAAVEGLALSGVAAGCSSTPGRTGG